MAKARVTRVTRVAFFCDNVLCEERLNDVVVHAILQHFDATVAMYIAPRRGAKGFESGRDWTQLKKRYGLVAIVTFNALDPCVYGICWEVSIAKDAPPVYNLLLGRGSGNQATLMDCNKLKVAGAEAVVVAGLVG